MRRDLARAVALAQGTYYVLSGALPFASMATFLWITGPKQDLWLVQTVGALIVVIGVVLLVAGARRATTLEVALLAVGSALALALVDVHFVAKGRISPVYLADAVVEALLVTGWAFAGWPEREATVVRA